MNTSAASLIEALNAVPPQHPDTRLAQSWLLGFDTETTGVAAGRDAIVSAALVLRDPTLGYEGDVIGEWIINPHRPMSPGASRVNGFTDAYLTEHGEEPAEAIDAIASIIAAAQSKRIPLLAYNAPFDVHMLNGDISRWNLKALPDRMDTPDGSTPRLLVVDPLVIDRKVSRRKGRRTLTDTTFYYGVEPHGDFHNATADTVASVDLIAPMATLYPQVGGIAIRELMDWQRAAYADWREDFNQWLASRGRRPVAETWF